MKAKMYGDIIRECRKSMGMSQRDLSTRSGVGRVNLSKIETGATIPGTDTFEKLIESCGYEIKIVKR